MKRIFFILFFSCALVELHGQFHPDYFFNIVFHEENNTLTVHQKIFFENTSEAPMSTLWITDWANAYHSTESPLAKRLVEEFNRSFYLSSKNKRGGTSLENITVNGEKVTWSRPAATIDQIQLDLATPLDNAQKVEIELNYVVQLPDAKFTGYGIKEKEHYFLDNFLMHLARWENGQWEVLSHLDLEDVPQSFGDYQVNFTVPKRKWLLSNLQLDGKTMASTSTLYQWSGSQQKRPLFVIGETEEYDQLHLPSGLTIHSNLEAPALTKGAKLFSLDKITNYLTDYLGEYPHEQLLLSQKKYDKRPFYGLTLVPGILKPFPLQFEYEIKALNTLLYDYLAETLDVHPRKDYWLLGGLHSYLMINYVKTYYPNNKLFSLIMRQPLAKLFLKNYHFTALTFEQAYLEFHEFILRRNLQQALNTPKDQLIRFNEQIGNPSQMGTLMNFLGDHEGEIVKQFIAQINNQTSPNLNTLFSSIFATDKISGFDHYFNARNSLDFSFDSFVKKKDSIQLTVAEKNNIGFPFTLGWVKSDTLINQQYFNRNQLNKNIKVSTLNADYLVINPTKKLPEYNPRNNWRRLRRIPFKPLRLSFIKDLENPQYNQVFYNPRASFNAYDGLLLGVRLNNKTVKLRPMVFMVQPFYASAVEHLVGSAFLSYNRFDENKDIYQKNFVLSGSSFHYDTNLRYSALRGGITLIRRDNNNLRNNKKTAVNLFGQYVHRDGNRNQTEAPNYTIGGLKYIYSNKGALRYSTFNGQVEFSSTGFGKIHMTNDYRQLFKSGRQFSIRTFAGAFLWRKDSTSPYFDFALDRPNDYLFEYSFFGRSETQGVYSQQFIPAEGGFKSKFNNPYANQFMLTSNLSFGLWKWIEAYGDIGVYKNINQPSAVKFDTGLRLNFVPDFLELYFPIYNSNGWQTRETTYPEKIRFVLVLEPTTLSQLFSRKWF